MTAAAAASSAADLPRLSPRASIAVVGAWAGVLVGLVISPFIVLGLLVAAVVVLGMLEVGRAVERTFEHLATLAE
jgi:hypothetical protein